MTPTVGILRHLLLVARGVFRWLTPRRFWWLLAGSTVAHLIFALFYTTHPGVDGVIYQRVARDLAESGNLLACGAFDGAYWPPLFCIYLGGLYTLLGEVTRLVFVLNVFMALATTLLAKSYLDELFGETTARWSALLFYNSTIIFFFTLYFKYELMAALLLGLCLAGVLRNRCGSGLRAALSGVAMGLAALTTSRVLALVPALLYWMLRRPSSGGWSVLRKEGLLFIAGLVVAIAPWTVRNYICLDKFVPITSNGAINFYMGFNAAADGSYNHNDKWPEPYNRTPNTDNATFLKGGWKYIRDHPDRALVLVCRKIYIMWRVHYLDSALFYPFFWFGVLCLPGLVGERNKVLARSVQLLFIGYTAVHCLFIARYYYLIPLLPFVYAIALACQRKAALTLLDRVCAKPSQATYQV